MTSSQAAWCRWLFLVTTVLTNQIHAARTPRNITFSVCFSPKRYSVYEVMSAVVWISHSIHASLQFSRGCVRVSKIMVSAFQCVHRRLNTDAVPLREDAALGRVFHNHLDLPVSYIFISPNSFCHVSKEKKNKKLNGQYLILE